MEEVEAICDRVLIMDMGLVIAEGTLKELKESMEESTVYNISGEGIENIEKTFFDSIEGVDNVEVKDSLIVSTRKDSNNLDKIILKLINEKVKIKNIVTEEQNLETIFLNLTGRNLRN